MRSATSSSYRSTPGVTSSVIDGAGNCATLISSAFRRITDGDAAAGRSLCYTASWRPRHDWENCGRYTSLGGDSRQSHFVALFYRDETELWRLCQRVVFSGVYSWHLLTARHAVMIIRHTTMNDARLRLVMTWSRAVLFWSVIAYLGRGKGRGCACMPQPWRWIDIKCDTRRRTQNLPSLRFSTPIRYDTMHKWLLRSLQTMRVTVRSA